MRPVHVSIAVPQPRAEVFEFLDLMANHELFTDHMLSDWEYSGPARGVGSKARVKPTTGPPDPIDIEVIAAEPPAKIVEQGLGAKGRRETNGIYTLEELEDGGTRISFELAWRRAPLGERLAAPAVRAIMRRENQRAMHRLAGLLADLDED